jgi:RNA polymerase sigma-70 factor (ECF subfamily)
MSHSPTQGTDPPSSGGRFEQTQWTIILKAREEGAPGAAEAMEEFARAYWPPLYRFIRREGYNRQDAQDLTQGFYQHFQEKHLLERITERNGKFRNYLLTCLKHFLSDERDRAAALKRGGGQSFISMDALEEEERHALEPADGLTADQIYERRWAQAVLASAQERLREMYATKGKAALYEALKDLLLGEKSEATYVEIARGLGTTEQAIKSAAKQLREQFFKGVRKEIERTVSDPREIDDEIRYLISVVAG